MAYSFNFLSIYTILYTYVNPVNPVVSDLLVWFTHFQKLVSIYCIWDKRIVLSRSFFYPTELCKYRFSDSSCVSIYFFPFVPSMGFVLPIQLILLTTGTFPREFTPLNAHAKYSKTFLNLWKIYIYFNLIFIKCQCNTINERVEYILQSNLWSTWSSFTVIIGTRNQLF